MASKNIRRILFGLASLNFAMGLGCTHAAPREEVASVGETTEVAPAREPAAVETSDNLKLYFDLTMHAQKYLEAFDRALDADSAKSIIDSDEYLRLIAVRMLKDDALETIADSVKTIVRNEQTKDFSSSNAAVVDTLKSELGKNGLDQIISQNIYSEILKLSGELKIGLKSSLNPRASELVKVAEDKIFANAEQAQLAYDEQETAIAEKAAAASSTDIEDEVNEIVAVLKNERLDDSDSREPQSTRIVASPGGSGQITGREYPRGTWSLTFDDGPHGKFTSRVLANLRAAGMKASFFWLAQNARANKSVVSSVKAAGMDLCNHSYSHKNLPKQSAASLRKEIVDSSNVLAGVYGSSPTLFRCPYGACGGNGSGVRNLIAQQNMISVNWNVDSLDWQDHNPTTVYNRVKKQMNKQGGGIILFHDIHAHTIEASRKVMSDLSAGGYRSRSVQHMINEINGK